MSENSLKAFKESVSFRMENFSFLIGPYEIKKFPGCYGRMNLSVTTQEMLSRNQALAFYDRGVL